MTDKSVFFFHFKSFVRKRESNLSLNTFFLLVLFFAAFSKEVIKIRSYLSVVRRLSHISYRQANLHCLKNMLSTHSYSCIENNYIFSLNRTNLMKIASLMVLISISNITRRKIIMLRPTFAAH